MTCYRRWSVIAALALGLAAGAAEAQPGPVPPVSEIRRAEPVVVTATRSEERLERIGASVTVIPGEVLEAQEYRTVEEALRAVPGLDVQRSGSSGKLTTIRIRGAGPTQIQVLVDGVRVKSTTTGDFDFADLTVDAIERIEVVRGPQSTAYGADAIGGVVHVITKRGRGAPSAWVDVEGGSYGTHRERAGASGAVGPWSFSLGVSRLDSDGQFRNDEHALTSLSGRVAYALPGGGELALGGRYSDGHRGLPFKTVFPTFDPDREQDDRLALLSLEWRQKWAPWYEHALRASLLEELLTFRDRPDPGETGPGFRSDITSGRREVEWLNQFHLGTLDTVTVGLEYRNEEGTNKGTFSRTTDTWSIHVQNQLRLLDRLFVTAGVRRDDNSAFGGETTGRVALSYLLKETDSRLKASWGQGFRAPTFNELFYPATFPPCPAFGNPRLQPEKSESWDAGVEQEFLARRVRVGATYFRNDFRNLIETALIDPVNFCFQARNVGRARTQGVEAEASVTPAEGLLLGAAYTYTDTEDRATGLPLRRFPKHRLALSGSYEPLPGLSLAVEVHVVGSQLEAPGQPRNDGYTVVNAAAAYRLPWTWGPLSSIVLHLKATNLFNESYAETQGFPALGTQVIAGLRATFD